ncbi:hypothetical protein [Parafrankia discariae]|uniref:hypothetical protein n=1 Tax=Parafrankia discariae TaxID=365528 RepID=UPI000369C4E9|nr:hypothetical protein [Parafrankia discariae]
MDTRDPQTEPGRLRRFFSLLLSALAVASVLLGGCGGGSGEPAAGSEAPDAGEANPAGDIPDDQAFVPYRSAGGSFTVSVPEGWAQTAAGESTTFTDKLNRVEIRRVTAAAAPTTQSVVARVEPGLRAQVAHFEPGKASTVSRRGGQAVLFTYQGDAAPDPVTGKIVHDAFERYAFYRGGVEVDLTLSGPVGADNVDPWRIVSDSFAWSP